MRKQFEKQAAKLGLVGAAALAFVEQCMAAVPTEVTTALADGKADTLAVAGLSLVIIISVAVFKYMRRGV